MTHMANLLVMGGLASHEISHEERVFLEKEKPIGLTLFSRNLGDGSVSTVKKLTDSIRELLGQDALIAIDQEGGRVARFKPPHVENPGPAMTLAQGLSDEKSLNVIEEYGFRVASALAHYGVNINFAPVLDCLSEPKNACIGDRAFGSDAKGVMLRAGAYLKGLQRQKQVWGCLKHFPGQGHGLFDTHETPCIIDVSEDVLWKRELEPFLALKNKAAFMMTSHGIFPAWDKHRPASLSSAICGDLLRQKIGFSGILISDDLMMKAISQDEQSWSLAVVEAIAAGCDMVLVCEGLAPWRLAIEVIRKEAQKSKAFAHRVEESTKRIASRFAFWSLSS